MIVGDGVSRVSDMWSSELIKGSRGRRLASSGGQGGGGLTLSAGRGVPGRSWRQGGPTY